MRDEAMIKSLGEKAYAKLQKQATRDDEFLRYASELVDEFKQKLQAFKPSNISSFEQVRPWTGYKIGPIPYSIEYRPASAFGDYAKVPSDGLMTLRPSMSNHQIVLFQKFLKSKKLTIPPNLGVYLDFESRTHLGFRLDENV